MCIFTHIYLHLNVDLSYYCVLLHNAMTNYEMKRLEMELKQFTINNFDKPINCRNLEQVRFYIKELCAKIEELEMKFNYVPEFAYTLLAQYNARQNNLLQKEFSTTYS